MLIKKKIISVIIATACACTPVSFGVSSVNADEWNDWYNNLSDDEKLYVNYNPNGNTDCADDYSNYIIPENVTNNYELRENDEKLYCIDSKNNFITGWIEIDGNKYYFKKDGSAVTKNTTIGGKRYKFASDGKYLGTFTGWSKSKGNKYYYKKGVLQTGWITVKGKKYYAAKTGVIRTGWVAADGDIYYFDKNGIWDGKTYKSWDHVYKPKTVGDFLLDFDYPTDALYEINYNEGKYLSFDNIELIREILENESKTKFIYDDILSDDEVQEELNFPDKNTIMIRSTPKQDEDKKMPHLKFSKDSSGNVYLYCPFYNFGCILDDNSVYDKLLSEMPSANQKSEITDEAET